MRLGKVRLGNGDIRAAIIEENQVRLLKAGITLSDILHGERPIVLAAHAIDANVSSIAVSQIKLLCPLDKQEVWGSGVTYKRSSIARQEESPGAARFYDLAYTAKRPEIFFKAPAWRSVGTGERVHIRRDSKWSVPEPELTLIVSPRGALVGLTLGNDMSARDVEGENPLYLPQAKCWDHSCSVGPTITLADAMPPLKQVEIRLIIERGGKEVFKGQTSFANFVRTPEELIGWLFQEMSFPDGVALLTGTGIVPPDEFSLAKGDVVHMDATGVGRLTNYVEMRA